ncbi:MAG: ATP-binding cassette domain-containing protein, partial [Anaerotignaceae bacterium]
SMTMYAITGLLPEKNSTISGEIIFHNQFNILKMNSKQKREFCSKNSAIILQNSINALNPNEKIYKQLMETVLLHNKISKQEAMKKILEVLKEVDIEPTEDNLNKYPHQFSGGMRQRIAIAMALQSPAKLLIADEPTTSLDAINQMKLAKLIKRICQQRNLSLIYISHNLGLVDIMCEKVIVIHNGEIVEEGLTKEVFSSPQNAYTKELVEGTKMLLTKEAF